MDKGSSVAAVLEQEMDDVIMVFEVEATGGDAAAAGSMIYAASNSGISSLPSAMSQHVRRGRTAHLASC